MNKFTSAKLILIVMMLLFVNITSATTNYVIPNTQLEITLDDSIYEDHQLYGIIINNNNNQSITLSLIDENNVEKLQLCQFSCTIQLEQISRKSIFEIKDTLTNNIILRTPLFNEKTTNINKIELFTSNIHNNNIVINYKGSLNNPIAKLETNHEQIIYVPLSNITPLQTQIFDDAKNISISLYDGLNQLNNQLFISLNRSIKLQLTSTDEVHLKQKNKSIIVKQKQLILDNLTKNEVYTLTYSNNKSSTKYATTLYDLNLTQGFSIRSQFVENYSGILPSKSSAITPIFALEDPPVTYSKAQVILPKNNLNIQYIYHCTDWNFTTQNCSMWEENKTDEYDFYENISHIVFNVSGFDAYGAGPGNSLANITNISIYDVTEQVDKQVGGILIGRGVDTNFHLTRLRTYRIEFNVTNDGEDFIIENTDSTTHQNISYIGNVTEVWYVIDSINYSDGYFNAGIVNWNGTLGSQLNSTKSGVWYYIINVTTKNTTTHDVNWIINDTSSNSGSIDQSTFTIQPHIDIVVNESSIQLTEQPTASQTQNITLTVYNRGEDNSSNFTIQLYNKTTLLYDTSINISAHSMWSYNYSWTGFIGQHNLTLFVDTPIITNGSINETNEQNNNQTLFFNISSWHTFFGDVRNDIVIGSGNSRLHNWSLPIDSGNIYFADEDVLVNFANLEAIGRTTLGTTSLNDFTELDQTLNLTNSYDSLSSLFAIDASTPKQTRSFDVEGSTINNVPFVNSTNNSQFVTGILWDTTTDTNLQYDFIENEPILFVTEINFDQQGKYGVYDYEIIIPPYLQKTSGVTNSMAIYLRIQ